MEQKPPSLTEDSIREYASGSTDFSAFVQIIKQKEVGKKKKRQRVWISDGTNCVAAMIGKSKDETMNLKKYSIIKVTDCVLHTLGERRVLVILQFQVISEMSERIGNPKQIQLDSTDKVQPITPRKKAKKEDTPRMQNDMNQLMIQNRTPPDQRVQQQRPVNHFASPSNRQPQNRPQEQRGGFQQPNQRPQEGRPMETNQQQTGFSPSPLKKGKKKKDGFGNPRLGRGRPVQKLAPGKNMPPLRDEDVRPLSHLNPYDNWTVKVRVVEKSKMREWHRAERSGKLQSFKICDSEKTEMEMIMFNDEVKTFGEQLEVGGMYLIGGGKVKHANRKYTNAAFQIILNRSSQIKKLDQDDSIPTVAYNFVDLSTLEGLQDYATIDVFGFVKNLGDVAEINTKRGDVVAKRSFDLVNLCQDGQFRSVSVSMWGDLAQNPQFRNGDIVTCKNMRKTSYSGVSLSTVTNRTKFAVNPNIPEVQYLRNNSQNVNLQRIEGGTQRNQRKYIDKKFSKRSNLNAFDCISDIRMKRLGTTMKEDYITIQGYITHIDRDKVLWYNACPNMNNGRTCMKKVDSLSSDGTLFKCNRCNCELSQCDKRYLLTVQIMDSTGTAYATVFQESGLVLFDGKTADELYKLREGNEQATKEYEKILRKAMKKFFIVTLKLKQDSYGGNTKVGCNVVKFQKPDFLTINKRLVGLIRKYDELDMMDMTE